MFAIFAEMNQEKKHPAIDMKRKNSLSRPSSRTPRCTSWLCWVALLLLAGCYDGAFDEGSSSSEAPTVTTTIAALQTLHRGTVTPIEGEVTLRGRVTANTQGGNFYRSMLLEEEGSAVEVLIAIDALHNDYPIGAEVVLSAEWLALDRSYGILRIGPRAKNDPTVLDYLASKAAADKHLFRTREALITPTPYAGTLDQLTPNMAGRLCQIEQLQHTPLTPTENCWSGERRFTDPLGRELYTYVRTYADLANRPLPVGRCTIVGILEYDHTAEGRYLIKPRYEGDIW